MTADDLADVWPLLKQLGSDMGEDEVAQRFEAVAAADQHAVWVAIADGRVIGFLHAFGRPALEKPPEAIVQAMVVDETKRGAGIGWRLMARVGAWPANWNFGSVLVDGLFHFFQQIQRRERNDLDVTALRGDVDKRRPACFQPREFLRVSIAVGCCAQYPNFHEVDDMFEIFGRQGRLADKTFAAIFKDKNLAFSKISSSIMQRILHSTSWTKSSICKLESVFIAGLSLSILPTRPVLCGGNAKRFLVFT